MKIIGYLKDIVGDFYAKNNFGILRKVDSGDAIFEKEIVVDSKDFNYEIKDPLFVACKDNIDKCLTNYITPKSYVINENIIERSGENIFNEIFMNIKNNIIRVLNDYQKINILEKYNSDTIEDTDENIEIEIEKNIVEKKEPIINNIIIKENLKEVVKDVLEELVDNTEKVEIEIDKVIPISPIKSITIQNDDIQIPVIHKSIIEENLDELIPLINITIQNDDIQIPVIHKSIIEENLDELIPLVNITIQNDDIQIPVIHKSIIEEDLETPFIKKENIVKNIVKVVEEEPKDKIIEEVEKEQENIVEPIIIKEVIKTPDKVEDNVIEDNETNEKIKENDDEFAGYSSSVAFIKNGEQTAIIDDDNNFNGDFDISEFVLSVTLEIPDEDYMFDDDSIDWDLSEDNHRLTGFSDKDEIIKIDIDNNGIYQGDFDYSKYFSDMDINIIAKDAWGDSEKSKINIIVEREEENEIEDKDNIQNNIEDDTPIIEEVFSNKQENNNSNKNYEEVSREENYNKVPLPLPIIEDF